MADSKPPVEAPGPKNEVLETPPAVNVPTTSTTSSPKKEKKLSLYSRFVNMVTPTVYRCGNASAEHCADTD